MNNTQKVCPHVFIGKSDGVHCTRCGLHLTAQQYHDLLHPPEQATDEKLKEKATEILKGLDIPAQTVVLPEGASLLADEISGSSANPGVVVAVNAQIVASEAAQNAPSNEGDKEPTEPQKAAQTATEPPQAKPKRTRKKKEATTSE